MEPFSSETRIARSKREAAELLELWERSADGEGPSFVDASSHFFLPYTESLSDCVPWVALWAPGGRAAGILVGRQRCVRPKRTVGGLRIPMPELQSLEVVYGGLQLRDPKAAEWAVALLRSWLDAGELDSVSVHPLEAESGIGRLLEAGLRSPADGLAEPSSHWFAELVDAQGEPVVANSARTRRTFRRKDRQLEQTFDGGVAVRVVREPGEVEAFTKLAASIGDRSYQGALGVGVRDDARWRSILGIHAAAGCLRGYVLEARGEAIAYVAGPLFQGTFTLVATSFLPEHRQIGPGGYLIRRVIESLQEEGARWLDFGFGEAAYKELHGTLQRDELGFRFYGSRFAARVASGLDRIAARVDRVVRELLARTGLVDRARRIFRGRAEGSS